MTNLGRLLLAIGFFWLTVAVIIRPTIKTGVTSQIYDSIPKQKETFNRNDITNIIAEFDRRYPGDDLLWMLAPAGLMLVGGFLLDRAAIKKKPKVDSPVTVAKVAIAAKARQE